MLGGAGRLLVTGGSTQPALVMVVQGGPVWSVYLYPPEGGEGPSREPATIGGSSQQMAFADSIEDELHCECCEQDTGNAGDHICAGYAQHASERIDQHQCGPGQRQAKQQCEQEDDNLQRIGA